MSAQRRKTLESERDRWLRVLEELRRTKLPDARENLVRVGAKVWAARVKLFPSERPGMMNAD